MEEVRRLAQTAALIAAQLTTDEVVSFRWETTPGSGVYQVTLELKEGDPRVYTVIERQPGSKRTPELSPW